MYYLLQSMTSGYMLYIKPLNLIMFYENEMFYARCVVTHSDHWREIKTHNILNTTSKC